MTPRPFRPSVAQFAVQCLVAALAIGHHGQAIDQRGAQARQHAGEHGRLRVLCWGGGRL